MIRLRPWFTAAVVALTSGVLSAQSPAPAASPAASAAPPAPTAAPVVPKNVIPDIKARGKLIVGVKFDVRLFGLNNPITKKVEGFDADLARALGKALLGSEDKVELIEAISANRIPFLQEDKADLVISTMTITDARRQQIDFSDTYYVAGQSLLVPKGSAIKSVKDLAGKVVTTVQGSTSEKELIKQSPTVKPLLLKSYSECFTALQNGQAEAMTTDDIILMGLKSSDPTKFDLVGGQFTTEPYGIGLKKGRTDLLAFVNDELRKMKTDGRWKALYDKHLKPLSGTSAEPPK